MRFIIYGAGGIGGTIGARLFQQGKKVVLIARGAHLEAIKRSGLRFITPKEQANLEIPTVGHPSEIEFDEDDVVILCVKSQHTPGALDDLQSAAGDDVAVVANWARSCRRPRARASSSGSGRTATTTRPRATSWPPAARTPTTTP